MMSDGKHFWKSHQRKFFSALLESSLLTFLSEICIEVITTEKEEKQLLFEAKEKERKTIEVECLYLTEEVVVEEAEKISRNIYMDIKTKWLEIIGQNLYHDIISEILTSEIFDIANEIHYKEMEIKRNMLKAIQEEMKLIRIRKVLDRWKQLCMKRRQLDEARKTFPSAPPLEMKNYKTPNGKRDALNFSKHLQKQCVLDLTVKDQLKNTIFSEPLDLKNILWNLLFLKYETFLESYTYKLLLILPMETDNQSYLWKKWFTEKFKKDCSENSILKSGVQTISLYTAEIERNQNMLICIKSIDSKLQDSSIYQELLGTNAFIFVIGYWESSMQEFQDKLEEEGQRLIEYINYRLVYPPVPVYIFVVNNHSSKLTNEVTLIIENSLDLPYLKSNNLIFDWKISLLHGVGKPNNDFQLLQSVKWLAENTQIIPYLTAAHLKDFLEDGITKFVFNLVYSDLGERHKHGIYHQCPRAIIALYTAAISHMIDVTCSSYLEQLSWPMPEIAMIQKDKEHPPVYWNSSEQLRKVEKIIRNIQLKEYPENLSTEHKDDVWQYVDLIIADSRNKSLILKSNIHHLLSRSKNLDGEEVIPWADILQACSFFLLDNIDFVCKETNREWMIYYLKDKFEQFYPPEKWNDMIHKSFWLPAIDTSVRKRKHSLEEKESKEIKLSSPSTSSLLLSQVFDETVQDLNKELESERETSRSFTQLLKKLADEEIVDQEVPTLDIIKSPLINHPANNTNISEMSKTWEEFTLCQEDSLETKLKQLQMKLESERKANKLFKTKLLLIKQEDSFV
ncbi:germinal-center associated nuclear protein isoform X2 [Centruroides vittatus]|uniref:germinal-center associated nuclear protein isoform X2 n=1 Tax=Centruroides vittatus TaxID=120091 RepID=UPI003510B9E1